MGMRPYWADYANHMLRFFAKNNDETMIYRFKTRTDEMNWKACKRVMDSLRAHEREIILYVYGKPLFLEDAVNEYLAEHKMEANAVWDVIYTVSKRVAQMRGLL